MVTTAEAFQLFFGGLVIMGIVWLIWYLKKQDKTPKFQVPVNPPPPPYTPPVDPGVEQAKPHYKKPEEL